MRCLKKTKFLLLLICTLSFNVSFSAETPPCIDFPEGTDKYVSFEKVCDVIRRDLNNDGPSCFISYAWHREGNPLNEWSTKFNEFLSRAGIAATYDTSPDRGLQGHINSFISEIAKKQTAIVLLTPQYKENVQLGKFVKEEVIRILEHKPLTRFVLLAGSSSTSVPEEFSPLRDSFYYPMTTTDVYDVKEYPGPTESLFYSVLCDLLDPNRHNLLRLLNPEKKGAISSILEEFRESYLSQSQQDRADVTTPAKPIELLFPDDKNSQTVPAVVGSAHSTTVNITGNIKGIAHQVNNGSMTMNFN